MIEERLAAIEEAFFVLLKNLVEDPALSEDTQRKAQILGDALRHELDRLNSLPRI